MGRQKTREEWLTQCINALRPRFKRVGYPLPEVIHVSTGFALATKVENIYILGNTFSKEATDDDNTSVFVSPFVKDTPTAVMTVLHELIHVALNNEDGHRLRFREIALALGFQSPLTHLNPSIELEADALTLAARLGDFPNPGMDRLKDFIQGKGRTEDDNTQSDTRKKKIWSAPPQQGTRMLKCWCPRKTCGYTIRTTQKWIDVATPICPVHKATKMKVQVKS